MEDRTAFVAMKFDDNHWKDKRYIAISEVLEEVGYKPLRADQIKSSEPIVDEVCDYLENSEIVIIDSTGDSHSVSYEIGYCHGVGRLKDKTILIRQGVGNDIPFNYRHFRHFCYKDIKHLKRLLRDWFSVTVPLTNDQIGYVFNIIYGSDCGEYGYDVAKAIVTTLERKKFSGRCEYYAADGNRFGMIDSYLVGVGLKDNKNATPSLDWWLGFRKSLDRELAKARCSLSVDLERSELGEIFAFRQNFIPRGAAQFLKGKSHIILNPNNDEFDSFFTAYLSEVTQQGH